MHPPFRRFDPRKRKYRLRNRNPILPRLLHKASRNRMTALSWAIPIYSKRATLRCRKGGSRHQEAVSILMFRCPKFECRHYRRRRAGLHPNNAESCVCCSSATHKHTSVQARRRETKPVYFVLCVFSLPTGNKPPINSRLTRYLPSSFGWLLHTTARLEKSNSALMSLMRSPCFSSSVVITAAPFLLIFSVDVRSPPTVSRRSSISAR